MSINTIKKTKDFNDIYNKSKKIHTKYTVIFIKKNKTNQSFGFVASKKTGNAVQRNRIKRLLKEFVKSNINYLKKDNDYIFVGKAILKENLKNIKYKDIENDILKGLKK